MADRYWVGGTANWDATAGTKWALTSGGAGGQAVPTASDDVYFDAASGAVTCTVSTSRDCRALNFTGFTGTIAGTGGMQAAGNVVVSSSMTWTFSGSLFILGGVTQTLTTNGKSLTCIVNIDNGSTICNLADALTTTASVTVTRGTLNTNNYAVTATSLSSSNSNTRTINLGSSTVTLSANSPIAFTTNTNLTFNAGTSSILFTSASAAPAPGATGVTFYDVTWTSTALTTPSIQGACTFNNLTVAGRTGAGISNLRIDANQTINGTLTLSAGTNATMRTFVRSNTIGTTRTLTCAAVASLTDIDFRDITIAGAAAPVSGTRLGDCKGNSGITFPAAKTAYRVGSGTNWQTSNSWSNTSGGTGDNIYFPLAQDLALFESTAPSSGVSVAVGIDYNIGTIDMSARTSNTMTFACSQSPVIYGNWINGTGVTFTGAGTFIFAGRGSQTITTAGRTFTQSFNINTPGSSVTLQDAFVTNRSNSQALAIAAGTFDANNYNVSLTGASAGVNTNISTARTVAIGSGTWTIAGTPTAWEASTSTNLTVTGTGTISLTSASAKTFAGGGIQTYPTLNQGGTGTLTVTGSNKFAGLTNTAIGRIQFTGGTTNIFNAFNISGVLGNLLQLGSTNTTQAILQKGSSWLMGANSTDAGNNTNLSFTAGGGIDYLSVSYINGTVVVPVTYAGNFFVFF